MFDVFSLSLSHSILLSNIKEAEELTDQALLKYYTDEWRRFTTGASYVNRLFTYLNRHWIKREKDEGKKNVYPVYTVSFLFFKQLGCQSVSTQNARNLQLALVTWRDHFFKYVQQKTKLTAAVLALIERQRNGQSIDTSLLERVVESLVALGIDEQDTNRTNLDVYKEGFEVPFVTATEQYYKTESVAFIAENTVTDYMLKAEARLKEEEDRVDMYLNASSRKVVSVLLFGSNAVYSIRPTYRYIPR